MKTMTKKNKKEVQEEVQEVVEQDFVEQAEPQVDEELKEVADKINAIMKENKVALQPYIRPIINELGFKTGEVAAVELVRHEK
jgi:division protein CdvB (Snf7/Vps24/ESCRT-III family)